MSTVNIASVESKVQIFYTFFSLNVPGNSEAFVRWMVCCCFVAEGTVFSKYFNCLQSSHCLVNNSIESVVINICTHIHT